MATKTKSKVNDALKIVAPTLFETTQKIESTHTSELVIALCGPIGSPLHDVADTRKEMLTNTFGYEKCETLRLSKFIEERGSVNTGNSEFDRINGLIVAGNELRSRYGANVLAELAVHSIRLERERFKSESGAAAYETRRICHIIDSIKNQEELELLKTIYRDMLYVVGVFSPLEIRVANLGKRGIEDPDIWRLIDRDSGEESKTGQTVRDTFPQSDFFLRVDRGADIQVNRRVERFLHLMLGTKILTPTAGESAMYAAASAAGNSACLSRQVGAAIADTEGQVLSIGWNDVLKAGGGLYTASSSAEALQENDMRCWNRGGGKCFNDEEKDLLANAVAEFLVSENIIDEDKRALAASTIAKTSKLRGLIEFSRSIHAEMHAILSAARSNGSKIAGGKLFVTTYPCHSCARHIIAAGIKEVYYIEPYRKSLAMKLHDDAISESETANADFVKVLPYDGVAPSKYLALFRMKPDSRKKAGKMIKIVAKDAMPRLEKSLEALPALEGIVVKSLTSKKLIEGTANEQP
ncbi:MAG: anti-phage dCTP deaminase [Betaproteobacteria bacterium]